MNCSNHTDREPIAMCVSCNKLICRECAVKINNKYYCKECVSEMYSNNSNNINKEKVREYADKTVNATMDATNEALNLVKDFSNSEGVKKIINNHKEATYVLAIIAIALLIPKVINNLGSAGYLFEDLFFSLRYYGIFRSIFYLINIVATFIQPLILVLISILSFNNFMKLNKRIRVIAPIVVTLVFLLIRFVSANIAFSYFNFHVILEVFSYTIPVALISIAGYLDKE